MTENPIIGLIVQNDIPRGDEGVIVKNEVREIIQNMIKVQRSRENHEKGK